MFHAEADGEFGVRLHLDGLLQHKDGIARHVAASRTGVDAPGGVGFAVDGIADGAGDAFVLLVS
jgi:hypothetical protein